MTVVMKRRLSRHVLAVLAAFLFTAYLLRLPIQILFQSRDEYAIDPEWPLAPSADPPPPQHIPKIIHHVYGIWSDAEMPADWAANRKGCMEMHPDYEFKLWDGKASRQFLEEKFPWFLETWENYRYPVERADSIRYFILLTYGGMYLDLDVGCKRRIDPLLKYPAIMAGVKNMGLSNSIMGSMPNHPYFENLVSSLQSYDRDWWLPYLTIMNDTGPHFVSFVWIDHLARMNALRGATSSAQEQAEQQTLGKVHILMKQQRSGHEESFFSDGRGKSWHNWDNYAFSFVDAHPLITTSMFLPLTAVLYGMTWCLWSAIAARSKRVAWHKNLYSS
jgi:mannosyltransferase OCH1-like enzyme